MRKKSMFNRIFYWSAIWVMAGLLSGCLSESGSDSDPSGNSTVQRVTFDYSVKGLLQNVSAQTSRGILEEKTFEGTLFVKRALSGEAEAYPWFAEIGKDDATHDPVARSESYLLLEPGSYLVTLKLENGQYRYESNPDIPVVVSDGNMSQPELKLYPVIGLAVGENGAIEEIAEIDFSYLPGLLQGMGLLVPRLELKITDKWNVSRSHSINLNPSSTETSVKFVYEKGEIYTIQLALFDGAAQIGKSIPEQETVVFDSIEKIHMDIAPLYGDLDITLPVDGGDATFAIMIPEEIINAVGGIDNLRGTFTYTHQSFTDLKGTVDLLIEAMREKRDISYKGIATVGNFHYGTVVFSFQFYDTKGTAEPDDDEKIALAYIDGIVNGVQSAMELDAEVESLMYRFSLWRSIKVNGNLFSRVSICVRKGGEQAVGARLFADGKFIGLTDEDPVAGKNGCYEHYVVPKKDVVFRAEVTEQGSLYSGETGPLDLLPNKTLNVKIEIDENDPETLPSDVLHFDGVNDHVLFKELGDALQGKGSFTMELKFKVASPRITGPNTLFSHCDTEGERCTLLLQLNDPSGSNPQREFTVQVGETTGTVSVDEWNEETTYLVSIAFDGSKASHQERVKFYLNGAEREMTLEAGQPVFPAVTESTGMGDALLGIRMVQGSLTAPFPGSMDELRLWSPPLTLNQINVNMEILHSSGLPTDMVSFYDFSDGEGGTSGAGSNNTGRNTLTDRVGDNNGTLVDFDLTGTSSNWM